MSLKIFGPTAKNSGGAMFAETSLNNECFFIKFVKQNGWDDQNKKGIFLEGASFKLKFSQGEVSGIIQAVETKGEWTFFHSFEESKSFGRFSYYTSNYTDKQGNEKTKEGFGFTAKSGEVEIKIGISLSDARMFAIYLQNSLNWMFNNDIDKDDKERQEYFEKQKAKEAAPAETPKATKPAAKSGPKAPKKEVAPPVQESEPASEDNGEQDPPF